MKRPPFFILPLLAIALIGSKCDVRVSTGQPVPPPPPNAPPPGSVQPVPTEGLVIRIQHGDPIEGVSTASTSTHIEPIPAEPIPAEPIESPPAAAADATTASPAQHAPPATALGAQPVPIPLAGSILLLGTSVIVASRSKR